MFKRLKGPSGSVANQADQNDAGDKVTRPAILVHSGPDGSEAVFYTGDDPGEDPDNPQNEIKFDESRIKRIVVNQNKLLDDLAGQYGGFDKIPPGAFPPLLDQHENDSNNRIVGRMMAKLRFEKRDVPKVGTNVACAVTDITFLGSENVQRVADGRIFHLSIGIDESSDTLGETSTVIEPAAPGAMLLNRKDASSMVRLKKGVKHMGKNVARIQAHANRMSKLTAIKDGISTLSAGLKGASDTVKLTKKQGEVTHRLTGLMRAGKLTPAEFKKVDVKRLAALDSESLKTILDTYDIREPQVLVGQRGTTDAVPFTELAAGMKKKNLKKLKSEIVGDLRKMSGGKLKMASDPDADEDKDHGDKHEMGGGNKEEEIHTPRDPHAVPGEGGDMKMFKEHMAHCAKALAEGDVEGAKEHHAKAMAHMEEHGVDEKSMSAGVGDVKSEDYKQGMDALESKVDEMGTQLARFAGMVSELMDVEKEEGHQLEKEEEEKEPA